MQVDVGDAPAKLGDLVSDLTRSTESERDCDRCSMRCAGTNTPLLECNNKVLFVQLLRADIGGRKKSHSVYVDFELNINGVMYVLNSVIVHEGKTPDEGHYYTLLRSGSNWVLADGLGSTFLGEIDIHTLNSAMKITAQDGTTRTVRILEDATFFVYQLASGI